MQFQLRDPEKVSFLIIAGKSFTYDSPGPIEIDVEKLGKKEKAQLLYNCRRGALLCSDPDKFLKLCKDILISTTSYSPVKDLKKNEPVKKVEIEDVIEEDVKYLKKLLKAPIPSIKKQLLDLSLSQVKKLTDLEKQGKNRAKLLSFVSEFLDKQEKQVTKKIGKQDIGSALFEFGLPETNNNQISDIEESDIEKIVFNDSRKIF